MRRKGSRITVTDGPYAEVKEILGGFMIIRLCQDSPHFDYGSIEIRQVDEA